MPTRRHRRPVPKASGLTAAVASRIRELREKRDLSQAQLGEPYLTRAGISAIERGIASPSLHVLAFIARKLGVSARDLLPRR